MQWLSWAVGTYGVGHRPLMLIKTEYGDMRVQLDPFAKNLEQPPMSFYTEVTKEEYDYFPGWNPTPWEKSSLSSFSLHGTSQKYVTYLSATWKTGNQVYSSSERYSVKHSDLSKLECNHHAWACPMISMVKDVAGSVMDIKHLVYKEMLRDYGLHVLSSKIEQAQQVISHATKQIQKLEEERKEWADR